MTETLNILLNHIFKGDENAIELAKNIWSVSQVWDDLVDGDNVNADEINKAFLTCLFYIPTNPIFKAMPELPYHIYNVFLKWRDATEIENGKPSNDDLNKCYMLRAGIYDLFVLIAAKLYGDDHAKSIGVMVRRCYGEKLTDYKQEFLTCQIQ